MRNFIKRFEVSGDTIALTPALSSKRDHPEILSRLAPLNRDVAQSFQPAGSGDFLVASSSHSRNTGQECPVNPQTGMSALRGGSWRVVRRLTRCRELGKSSATLEQHEALNCCSLSPGERVRVRASVKTNFSERDGMQFANYGTKAIPKKQLERKLREAVRLARVRLKMKLNRD